jgi:hypothetical protein
VSGPAIHPRSAWGFPGWGDPKHPPYAVADSARTEFFVHYEGGTPTKDTGAVAMRDIDAGHRANGWSGIGYNFVVMLDGSAWEGRGWGLVGAHCPNHNTSGVGVQIHLGGAQQPTRAALATCRALYDEACRRSGRKLMIKGHQDGYATECPGVILEHWVKAGLPVSSAPSIPSTPTQLEDIVGTYIEPEGTQPGDGVYWVDGTGVYGVSAVRWGILRKYDGASARTITRAEYVDLVAQLPKPALTADVVDVAALADALAARLPAGWDAAEIAAVVVADLSARLAS